MFSIKEWKPEVHALKGILLSGIAVYLVINSLKLYTPQIQDRNYTCKHVNM